MKKKNTRNFTEFLVFFFLSGSSASSTTVGKFVDFELYYNLASHSLVETIHLGIREKRTANTLTKQTVHLYFVPFTWRICFNFPDFFFIILI